MLDQNTDRMWYVIGAVLIGAAIIFASSVMFPNAFASVGGMMDDVIHAITTPIPTNHINAGKIDKNNKQDGYIGTISGTFTPNSFRFSTPHMIVPNGSTEVMVTQVGVSSLHYAHLRMAAFNRDEEFIENVFYDGLADETKSYSLPEGTELVVFGWMDMDLDYYVEFK